MINDLMSKITIITNPAKTLSNPERNKKIKDIFGGNFRELKDFYERLSNEKFNVELYTIFNSNHYINVERKYKIIEEKNIQKFSALENITPEDNSENGLLFVLKRKSFKDIYDDNFKKNLSDMNHTKIIFVGPKEIKNSLKDDNLWKDNFYFLQRQGVTRIGKSNQNRILEILRD